MAQPTVQDVVNLARYALNDDDKTRDSDEDLAKFVNTALDDAFVLRPDLFIGALSSSGATEGHQLGLDDEIPIDGRWKQLLADYVVFRASMKEDEHVNSGRAGAALKYLESRLVG